MKCCVPLGHRRSIGHAYCDCVKSNLGDRNHHLADKSVIFFDTKERLLNQLKWCVLHFGCQKIEKFQHM